MNLKKEGEVQPAIGVKCQVLRAFSQVNYEVKKTIEYKKTVRPRLHGTGRIWDRSEIRPFSPVYTRIRPVRGSQIRPVLWFSCVYTDEFQTGPKFGYNSMTRSHQIY